MLHANIPQNCPKWVLCGHFFVIMPHLDTRIQNLMPHSCVESSGDSFDTHYDLVVQMGPKWRLVFAFDPGKLGTLNTQQQTPFNCLSNEVSNMALGQVV